MSDAVAAAPAAAPAAPAAAPVADVAAQATEALQSTNSLPESSSESSEGGSSTPASSDLKAEAKQAVKEAVVATKKKFNIKVDGKQLEKEIDLGNEQEVMKILQMAEMAQARAQEAAGLRKQDLEKSQQMEEFVNALKNDPKAVLEYLGHNVPELANKILEEEIAKMQLSPEQRKIQDLEAKIKAKEEAEQALKKQTEEKEMENLRQKYAAEYEKDLIQALDTSALPRNPEVVSRLTGMMKIALQNKIDISFADLIPLLREELNKDLKALIQSMSAEEVETILAEEKLKEINARRRKAAEASKPKVAPPIAESIKDTSVPKNEDLKKIDKKVLAKDFFKNLGKR